LKKLLLILLLLLPAPVSAQLTTSLTSFWELGEASGTRSDSHGTNHLTDNNTVTQAVGKVGSAAQLTRASSEYLSIADNASLSVGDISFTWAGWVYLDAAATDDWNYIVGKEGASSSVTDYGLRYTTADSTNRFQFFIGGSDYSIISANNFGAASTATWYFIVAWHDTGDDTINIQVNNGTANSTARTAAPADGTSALHVGGWGSVGPGRYWNGRIDQLGFWKRTLTAAEKTWLYNSGSGRTYTEVLAEGGGGGGGGGDPPGGTRLGLHVTQGELDVWRTRMTDSVNTINGFTYQAIYQNRIKADSDTFVAQSHPGGDGHWEGYTGGGCIPNDQSVNPGSGGTPFGRGNGAYMMRSAFTFLLTGNNTYGNPVKSELLQQITETGTDFTNSSKWCADQGSNGLEVLPWLIRVMLSYDYLVAGGYTGFSAGEHISVKAWLTDAATFWMERYEAGVIGQVYPGIFEDPQDLSCDDGSGRCSTTAQIAYFGGPAIKQATDDMVNNQSSHVPVLAMGVGLITSNATLITHAINWFTFFITVGVHDNGVISDYIRWSDCGDPGCAGSMWSHAAGATGALIAVADMYARNGDTSLYDLSVATQVAGGSGGTVNLLLVLDLYAKLANRTTQVYGTTNVTFNGDARYRLSWDSNFDGGDDERYYLDFSSNIANLYYNDSDIATAVRRNSLDSNNSSGCYDDQTGGCFSGVYGQWADIPFMFGNMESNAANPYLLSGGGGGGGRRRLSAVTNLSGQLAVVTPGTVNVSLGWSDPNTAVDQSEDGTLVDREIAGTFQQVGSVGPNVTQFLQSFPATTGSQQCYQVRPVYSDGELGADPSNEWCGTVPPCKQKGKSGNC
jgi:hypothetical protein